MRCGLCISAAYGCDFRVIYNSDKGFIQSTVKSLFHLYFISLYFKL